MLNSQINTSFSTFKIPEFRAFISVRFFLTLAYQMQGVAIGWHVYKLTKDPFSLGLIGLYEAIPAITIALYGGYIADKSNKKKVLLNSLIGFLFCSIIIFCITLPRAQSYFQTSMVVKLIYMMTLGLGVTRGFFGPVASSLIAQIVPRQQLSNAINWNLSAFQSGTILGPALGGLVYGFYGMSVTFVLVILFTLVALLVAFSLHNRAPQFVPTLSIWKSFEEGIQFVFKTKMMLWAMSLDLFSVLFGGAVALLPIFADEVLQVGAQGLGILRAASPLGAVITMLVMSKHSPMNKPWRNLLIVVLGFGLSIVCFGLSKNFYLSLFCLFAEGAFDSVSVMIRSTLLQLLTPDEMRGRVAAVSSIFVGSSNEIGAFESGSAAKILGAVPSVIFGGSMTLLIVTITFLKTRKLISFSLQDLQKQEVTDDK